jgi:hypothetical protein
MRFDTPFSNRPVFPVLLLLSFLTPRCLLACTITVKEPSQYARISTMNSELIVEVQLHHDMSLSIGSTFIVAAVRHNGRFCNHFTVPSFAIAIDLAFVDSLIASFLQIF